MTEFDRQKWNQKYQGQGLIRMGEEPSSWLKDHQELLQQQPKGPALDLACGNGRNSFFLIKQGFSVDAVDISDVAIDWLKGKAEMHAPFLQPKLMDLDQPDFSRRSLSGRT